MTMLRRFITNYWPVISLFLLVTCLFLINFRTNTWLTGWDNLHPEFFMSMNLKRSLFAVWQEYQGLGLLGGMGHASDFVHQIVLAILGIFLPDSLLRYVWTFLLLFIGSSGMYIFLRYSIFKDKNRLYPFLGAAFYLLNIATLQTFFVPFEAFIAHFAFLPWMLFASLFYYNHPTPKRLFLLCVILFLSTPAAYIPTLFLVYLLALGAMILTRILTKPGKHLLSNAAKLAGVILAINAFWLLPFAYFTLTNSQVNINSKINQMATDTIYSQNKEFGDISNVALLKGFWFNNVDPNFQQEFTYMLSPWRDHYAHFYVILGGYLIFAIILIGLISIFRRHDKSRYPLAALLFLCLTALAVTTPPFSFINALVRNAIPVLNQAFRFPFTKFSILTAFSYAILLSIGLQIVTEFALKKIPRYHPRILVSGIALGLMLLSVLPAFQGHLFYEKERIAIPQEYFSVFDFFKKQDPDTRIANFPQHTFWGWNFYKWGYGGSGFLWYGIAQPILDRAFDVWSRFDENYYYEVSQALYAKDAKAFYNVLQKYQISWLLIDRNIVNPISPKALFFSEMEILLKDVPGVSKERQFGSIEIYHVKLNTYPQHFVFATSSLPSANSYVWNNNDTAFSQVGMYQKSTTPQIIYPFRSLDSQKTVPEHSFQASTSPDSLQIKSPSFILHSDSHLLIPSSIVDQSVVPAIITAHEQNGNLNVQATVGSPEIHDGDRKIWGATRDIDLLSIPTADLSPKTHPSISFNGVVTLPLKSGKIGTTFLSLTQDNSITVGSGSSLLTQAAISSTYLRSLPELQSGNIQLSTGSHQLSVTYPAIRDGYLGKTTIGATITRSSTCDRFRSGTANLITGFDSLTFMALNATSCASFYMASLPHDLSYLVTLTHRNLEGRSLHFWALNQDAQYAPIDTYLPNNKKLVTDSFVFPPQEEFGQAYSFHFDNASIGQDHVENEVRQVEVMPIPYNFVSNLRLQADNVIQAVRVGKLSVTHPQESLYKVSGTTPKGSMLILSQAYDAGWQAYTTTHPTLASLLPFVFGQRLSHTEVNNWENGWRLDSSLEPEQTIVIVYLPQYLEYIGIIMTLGILGGSIFLLFRHRT